MKPGEWTKVCDSSACVEVLVSEGGQSVMLRNSVVKTQVIAVSAQEWSAFTAGVKAGAFDLD